MANRKNNFRTNDKEFDERVRVLLIDVDGSNSDLSELIEHDSDADPEYLTGNMEED